MNAILLDVMTSLVAYLLIYKYATLFIIAYLAALLIPLPSNTSLLMAAAFASQGFLNIYAVVLVALAANILGDWTGFWFSDKYGTDFLIKIGMRKAIESKEYKEAENFLHRNRRITIFVTRFFGGVGPLVNILAGLSKEISFRMFVIYDVLGETVYVLSLSLIGYFVGVAWENLLVSVESAGTALTVVVVLYIFYRAYRRRMQ